MCNVINNLVSRTMGPLKRFSIEFDRNVFYPGQMVSGRVLLSLDKPKELKGVELVLSGKAKCHWTSTENYTDSEGKSQTRENSHDGKETYFKMKMNLAGGKGEKYELPIGDYVYPFSMSLPAPLPPTYNGAYGGITYYGKAKLDIPWSIDKSETKQFTVETPINLNNLPELNRPYTDEKSKTFCCWCCASGPLTVTTHIPRTGYTYDEAIPITIIVDNASNVKVNAVKIELHQIITWKASDDTKKDRIKRQSHKLGEVEAHGSKTWTEQFPLGPDKYVNSGNCTIIQIKYELVVELDAKGFHTDLEVNIPITIGDIPYGVEVTNPFLASQQPSTGYGFVAPQPTAFGYNPASVAPASYPENTGTPYPGDVPYAGAPGSTPLPIAGAYPAATSTPNASNPPGYSTLYPTPLFPDAPPLSEAPSPSAPAETNPLLEKKFSD